MSMLKVAINGFGRIGRNVLRAAIEKGYLNTSNAPVKIVAVNDLTDPDMLAHLFKYDSVHGKLPVEVQAGKNSIIVNGQEIKVYAEADPAKLPWAEQGIDVVLESTGRFRTAESAQKHLQAGANKVVITAPAKGEDITIVMGVNHHLYQPEKHNIISNASCTTNCLAPVAKVLHEQFGIVRGMMTTVHSFTNDQRILDLPHKDRRRARAAALNIIPTTTGAASAVALVMPELKGRLNGMAMRVPTPNVSVVDLVCELSKQVTEKEINEVLQQAAAGELRGIMDFTLEPLVSRDFNGNPHSSIVDGLSTMVVKDNMVKVVAWYDNEWGYSNRVLDLAVYMGQCNVQ
ncbi:glyceraldehyde 3-phosphate dehydrogenase [Desulfotomaculum arcticum]|uniref:Glyceraldehyde-3-phosphate dehydrogenase n=1 Tax=Desulfotruncus arcticus DSM 17038 TaxID=1121424 RepID=A0A1I2YJK2_9FIRM|nr:type I glyceraldehyde-3-phosphate dehydrogenase [Desulfotruncus arcticus]SFH24721.1 glyceraldehyde 3-phosphate dehydrogenase [Desulfotomaculum arcticum] [Desulfotruncus arcticus DSM 17038]